MFCNMTQIKKKEYVRDVSILYDHLDSMTTIIIRVLFGVNQTFVKVGDTL